MWWFLLEYRLWVGVKQGHEDKYTRAEGVESALKGFEFLKVVLQEVK